MWFLAGLDAGGRVGNLTHRRPGPEGRTGAWAERLVVRKAKTPRGSKRS